MPLGTWIIYKSHSTLYLERYDGDKVHVFKVEIIDIGVELIIFIMRIKRN